MAIKRILFLFLLITFSVKGFSQEKPFDSGSLQLLDEADAQLLKEDNSSVKDIEFSDIEQADDLESLRNDIGDQIFQEQKESTAKDEIIGVELEMDKKEAQTKQEIVKEEVKVVNENTFAEEEKKKEMSLDKKPEIFEVGDEEKKLLELSKFVAAKMPEKEWNEIATKARVGRYEVQGGDYLWKIAQNLFGSGFYYSKIWALNPHITNPHEIEPGMILVFDTGSATALPQVQVGEFSEDKNLGRPGQSTSRAALFDLNQYGDEVDAPWLKERKKLMDEGLFFQYASQETYEDLAQIGKRSLRTEYEKYEPPVTEIIIEEPGEEYDASGFDKNAKVQFNVKEGFFLNTFVTTNLVQDFGEVEAARNEGVFIQKYDYIYVKFDNAVKVKPGDQFSIYTAGGKVSHPVSDRSGYQYTVVGQIKAVKKINDLWECHVTDQSGLVQRKDRITVFTPKIDKIITTFNKRNIEAAIIKSFRDTANGLSFGDVVYIDRGRADGVELGNVFNLYSFKDHGTDRKITPDPTYKIGELTVISLSDNFATALVSHSSREIGLGTIALSKTAEEAAREARVKGEDMLADVKSLEGKALDELDVELNLDDISEDLLNKADQIQLTEDELAELERQEREKSVIRDHEKDLKELERLESEILDAEALLNEAKVDEDKFLEQQNLDFVEKKTKAPGANAFESLNEIEQEVGRKYMDEDLNSKENPYGLTEFDLEEIDELLNTEKL